MKKTCGGAAPPKPEGGHFSAAAPGDLAAGKADSHVLGRLLIIQEALDTMPTIAGMADFLHAALGEVPGLGGCYLCVSHVIYPENGDLSAYCARCEGPEEKLCTRHCYELLPLRSHIGTFDQLALRIDDPSLLEPYHDYVRGIANAVAKALETRTLIGELNRAKDGLEEQVRQRTSELERTNRRLEREMAERKEAEQARRKFAEAVNQAANHIVVTDRDGMITYANPAFLHRSGYKLAEVIGQNPSILKSHLTPEKTWADLWSTILARRAWQGEFCNCTKDGEQYWVETTITPILEDGAITGFVAVQEDATARREALRALTASEQRFRTLVDNASDAIYIADTEGIILEANQAAVVMLGYTREELIGKPVEFIDPDWPPERFAAASANLKHQAVTVHTHHRHRGGHTIPVEIRANLCEIDQQTRIMALVRDITERQNHQRQLEELNRNLEQRVKQEVTASRRKDHLLLEQARFAALGEMMHHIAHQWRQPLSALSLILANIRDAWEMGELDTRLLSDEVEAGQEVIERMSITVDDFRSFFRRSGNPLPFKVGETIERIIGVIRESLANQGITMRFQEEERDIELVGLPQDLSQALLNLLTNARDAIRLRKIQPGFIDITLSSQADGAHISVRDNGGGIPESVRARIFDPYFTTKDKGTGLGLYTARMTIENNMGGTIRANNRENGAEFIVVLPWGQGSEREYLIDD